MSFVGRNCAERENRCVVYYETVFLFVEYREELRWIGDLILVSSFFWIRVDRSIEMIKLCLNIGYKSS